LIATGFDVKDIPGMPASIVKKLKEDEEILEDNQDLENNLFDDELDEQKKSADAEISKAMSELYGTSIKHTKGSAESQEDVLQIPFEAPMPEDLPTVDIAALDDEDNLEKVENIPAWKRKLWGKS
ncbi:MAG: hypothetical protein GX102_10880, partial [Porphyromonadaceae bacterium]|nr:hypothetical protein [Porphyromonadaceae bacterium]